MSSVVIAEKELPQELDTPQAVEAAYASELTEVASKLQRGLPCLIECEKELAPFLYANLRNRLRAVNLRCLYLDGRTPPEQQAGMMPMGIIGTMISQLREAVRGAVERRVVVLPHLDLLTTSQGGLTGEAREVITLLYENPELNWLGFKDPSFSLPEVINNLFPHRTSILGIARPRLRQLVTQREARKFGREFNPWQLYKHVSGLNAVRLRRLLSTLEGEDFPADPRRAYRQLRQATLVGSLEVPDISLERDIGGYTKVKERLRNEVLDILSRIDHSGSAEEITGLEDLIPKGMIFWGPPGTGKTLFAKAIAASIGAAITIVSGPELKSKWVGESEEHIRQIFLKARQSAPSIIVFDEMDSFASRRGTYTGSGVEHSMVNQLLTEMDGFHKEELVFVVGTTNFVEILDPALLRPGRFEFHLEIPYPEAEARREIIRIYDKKMKLKMTDEALEAAVKRTRFNVPGTADGTRFSGDHLNAMCRAIARFRLRENRTDETTPHDVERALTEWNRSTPPTKYEERVIAIHESGHAVASIFTEHSPPIERISLLDDVVGAAGYMLPQGSERYRYVETRLEILDRICVLMGGREAEQLVMNDMSMGSSHDLQVATNLARQLVELVGMGGDDVGVMRLWYANENEPNGRAHLSEDMKARVDRRVREILEEQRQRAADILAKNRAVVEWLADVLQDQKVIEAKTLTQLLKKNHPTAAKKLTTKEPNEAQEQE